MQQLTQRGDLYIEIFLDGLYDPPVDRGDQPAAGWGFIVVAYLPIDIGHGCQCLPRFVLPAGTLFLRGGVQ